MIHVVTGGAGFIGSHLVECLLDRGAEVLVLDDLSRGRLDFLAASIDGGRCTFRQVDCADFAQFRDGLRAASGGRRVAAIWHMAANSDIPAGVADPRMDLRDTFMTTFNALLLLRELRACEFHFASTSAIYGDWGDTEISEQTGPCRPISNYGAMKLASEAQVSATLEAVGRKATICRFPNVVGPRMTHGIIYDFARKLSQDSTRLAVLGDGSQRKSYMHVQDLISAMLFVAERAPEKVGIYNVGPTDFGVTVRVIAELVRDTLAPAANISYGLGNKGWVGDVPRFRYSVKRLADLGWQASMGSEEAVRRAIRDVFTSG